MYRLIHRPRKRKFVPKQPLLLLPVVRLITPPPPPTLVILSEYTAPPPIIHSILTKAHKSGAGGREGVIKYSGKYVKIYFNMKITFITIRSLNT